MTDPILVVAAADPRSSSNYGAVMRLRTTIESLSAMRPVELAVVQRESAVGDVLSGEAPNVSRLGRFVVRGGLSLAGRLAWLASPRLPERPLSLVGEDFDGVSAELASWMAPRYSLVWVVRSRLFQVVKPLVGSVPLVVDIDDLESEKLRAASQLRRSKLMGRPRGSGMKEWLTNWQAQRNSQAWLEYDRGVARRASVCLVCSEEDRLVLGSEKVEVLRNSYPDPVQPLGHLDVGRPPTILLQGLLTYPPNIDGAEFFVRKVLPLARQEIPDLRVRLVGRADERVRRLQSEPAVVVTGYVDDLDQELARADVVIAPVRFGGGTRIKILEALAHRIPLVTTSIGAYGLGIRSGTHALVADDAQAFADACVTALRDRPTRSELTRHGRQLYEQAYTQQLAMHQVRESALRLLVPPR